MGAAAAGAAATEGEQQHRSLCCTVNGVQIAAHYGWVWIFEVLCAVCSLEVLCKQALSRTELALRRSMALCLMLMPAGECCSRLWELHAPPGTIGMGQTDTCIAP